MLEISNLSVTYKKGKFIALKDINLQLQTGEIYIFIGPSGCGKSTLLNVISGIVKTYSGEVLLNNEKIDFKKKTIGLVPQSLGLLPWKNVYDNICLGLKIKKLDILKYEERIQYIMKKLSIDSLKNRYPNELSGGQKQRVAIARAFIMDLDLLLMDEPFSALDAITREETQELFFDIWKERKTTTLFVTHSVDEAVFLGKKIIIMSDSPARITRIVENSYFEKRSSDFRSSGDFFNTVSDIRSIIKQDWKKQKIL